MGFCRDTIKPAIRTIREQLTKKVLQNVGEYMELMGPLVKDGHISGKDAEKAVVYAVAAKHDVTKTAVGIAVGLIHETVARGTETYRSWAENAEADAAGAAEIEAFLT